MWQGRNGISIRGPGTWLPDWQVSRQILDIGIPAALEQVLITSAFFAMTILVASLGTLTLAAHRLAMNAMSLSFLPGIGFAMAATALVGQSIGAQRPAEGAASARIATQWSLIWMTGMGAVLFFFAVPIIRLFSDDAEVVAIGAAGLRMVALAQPFWAIFFVQSGALRGTGNTKFPLRVNATGIWLSVGLAYLFIRFVGGGLTAVWAAFLLLSPGMAGILWWRFQKTIDEQKPA
jgi:putative MATE family efflux protein